MLALRTFFPLAGLHGILVVGLWPLVLLGEDLPLDRARLGAWHADELIHGYVAAVLAGFILTALPRWTGKALVPPPPVRTLAALWFAGRVGAVVALVSRIECSDWIASLFPIALAVLVCRYIVAARNGRNAVVVILLALFAVSAAHRFMGAEPEHVSHFGQRIGIAAVLGLVMVFGGRITPALTDTVLAAREGSVRCVRRRLIEYPATLLAAAALTGWIMVPGAPVTAGLCAAAALGQGLRLAQWRGLSVIRVPSVCVFHAAYAGLPLGFALMALGSFQPAEIPPQAGLHAWTMGAVALMTLAVMTSMVRRLVGQPFVSSASANAAYALAGAAALFRVGAALEPLARDTLLTAAAVSWLAAFGSFLVFLIPRLLRAINAETGDCR